MSDHLLSASELNDRRIAELERQLAEAQATIQALRQQIAQQQAEIEALKRAGKRQAAPFARRERVEAPKKPGRKAGQGKFSRREKPTPEQVKETKVACMSGCPACGGELTDVHEHEQFEVDIPPVQPVITRFVSYSGYCAHCRKRVRSQHPEQISPATGAAGVVVGPRAKSLAANLKHRLGASYGKVSEALNDAFGLRVTRSGWCQADQRLAKTAGPVYLALIDVLRQCSVVHADETGWRMGLLSAWLWVFTNRHVTVYAIRDNRSHEVVVDILGQEFKGILSSDCFLAYDHQDLINWLKQKCVGHLLRDLDEMEANKTRGAVRFARAVTALLQQALTLKAEKPTLDETTFSQRRTALEARLDALIDPQRQLSDPDNARFAKRLRKQRPHLLRFLSVDELDATNNHAERQLRPAVVVRKTNGCNRSTSGADAHAILSSILATCRQHSIPIPDYLVKLQRFGDTPPPLASLATAPT